MRWISSSLKRKLSTLLLLSVLVPLLALGLFAYQMAATTTEEKAKQTGASILRQVGTNLEFMAQDIENMSLFLIGQKEVQQFLSGPGDDAIEQTQMTELLSNLVYFKAYISDITIYPLNKSHPVSNATIFETDLPAVDEQKMKEYQSSTKWWSRSYHMNTAGGTKQVISFIRPIRSLNSFKPLGTLVISLNERVVSHLLSEAGMPGSGYVVFYNEKGEILSSSNQLEATMRMDELLPGLTYKNGAGTVDYGEGDYKQTILHDRLSNVGWSLTAVMPAAEYHNQNSYVLQLTAVVIICSVILVAGLVLYFVQKVTKPLTMLTQFMKHSNPEEPLQTYPVESMDEVGQLVRSYNKLSDRISQLTEEVKQEELNKKEADMQALQAQINPHFLYNTLSSIHWMALMNRDDKTADMVGSLSEFLRFSLNKGEEFCSVEQEVAHASHYANIQSIRFPGKFKLHMDVAHSLGEQTMLKLLLQPLIENALIHGVQKQDGEGDIYVVVIRTGERMMFMVKDTGIGMDEARLYELRNELEGPEDRNKMRERLERGSYGLRNVHKRLQLHYGRGAGLTIESVYQKGTTVYFSLPLQTEEGVRLT